jgi:pimeloyl-ACP methyl ester carboxylesterase
MSEITYPTVKQAAPSLISRIPSVLLKALLGILGALAIILLIMPVAMSPISMSTPLPVWALLAAADLALIVVLIGFARTRQKKLSVWAGLVAVAALAVVASQAFAATPTIRGDDGKPLPGSIATLEKVNLNGSEQWITIRGKDVNKPVLLYLGIGGPGAGGFPASQMTLAPLEDHFVVVNWDQPGTGKSYNAVPISTLTVQRFVDDAYALTQMIRARFHQDKIYVMGLSWGTIVGIELVQQHPELYAAYVGTGQMVNTVENDIGGYELALQVAAERGDTRTVETLRGNGPPPYFGTGMSAKYTVYNNVLFEYMGSIRLEMVLLLGPQFAREYGLVDKVNFARGLLDSYPVLYPQLRDLDFTTQAAKLDVPIYFLHGQKDVNASAPLVERYYKVLQAPHKELVWLPSGHGATAQEIHDGLVNRVLVNSPVSR